MQDSLLWVYEGQTQFWGYVLEARSGLSSKQEVLDKLALIAAGLDNTPGRQWRPLIETTSDPIISARRPKGWTSFQRSEDYYNEGLLIWTEADAIIRQGTKGKRGMDDFARAFFGINDGDWGEVTYTFDDVVATLNSVYPYDWANFLRERVYRDIGACAARRLRTFRLQAHLHRQADRRCQGDLQVGRGGRLQLFDRPQRRQGSQDHLGDLGFARIRRRAYGRADRSCLSTAMPIARKR